jgi:hypothetical protein
MTADETTRQRAAADPGAEGAAGDPAAGIIDAGARILGQLLRSGRLVQSVRIALRHLDPEAAPRLARTLMLGDPVLSLELLSAAPALANSAILGLREALERLGGLPEELVAGLLPRLVSELRAEELGELVAVALSLSAGVAGGRSPALARSWAELEQGFARGWHRALRQRVARPGDRPAASAERVGGPSEGEPADAPLARCAVSGALGLGTWLADRLEPRLQPGTGLAAQARRLADGIGTIGRSHPGTVEHLLRPLAAACRELLHRDRDREPEPDRAREPEPDRGEEQE